MKYFVDSSFIVSLFKENDRNHKIAKKHINIIDNNECYITNGILLEVITILMKKTKNNDIVKLAYAYLLDNFIIVDEYNIKNYNDRVMELFLKYNNNNFKVSFVDCSSIIIFNHTRLDYVVSFDKGFKLFNEIQLYDF